MVSALNVAAAAAAARQQRYRWASGRLRLSGAEQTLAPQLLMAVLHRKQGTQCGGLAGAVILLGTCRTLVKRALAHMIHTARQTPRQAPLPVCSAPPPPAGGNTVRPLPSGHPQQPHHTPRGLPASPTITNNPLTVRLGSHSWMYPLC